MCKYAISADGNKDWSRYCEYQGDCKSKRRTDRGFVCWKELVKPEPVRTKEYDDKNKDGDVEFMMMHGC